MEGCDKTGFIVLSVKDPLWAVSARSLWTSDEQGQFPTFALHVDMYYDSTEAPSVKVAPASGLKEIISVPRGMGNPTRH